MFKIMCAGHRSTGISRAGPSPQPDRDTIPPKEQHGAPSIRRRADGGRGGTCGRTTVHHRAGAREQDRPRNRRPAIKALVARSPGAHRARQRLGKAERFPPPYQSGDEPPLCRAPAPSPPTRPRRECAAGHALHNQPRSCAPSGSAARREARYFISIAVLKCLIVSAEVAMALRTIFSTSWPDM